MTREHVWTRLEPRPNDQEMSDALQAPVRDPLWLLSRQWQVSEFEGEDAGSPIRADLSLVEDRLSRVDLRGAHSAENDDSDPFDYGGEPLEATVEGGRVLTDDDPPLRRRAETGSSSSASCGSRATVSTTQGTSPGNCGCRSPSSRWNRQTAATPT